MEIERADFSDKEEGNKSSLWRIISTLLVVLVIFAVTFTVITMLWPVPPSALPQAPQPDFLGVSLVRRRTMRQRQPVTPGSVMIEHSLIVRFLITFLLTLLIVLALWCCSMGTRIRTLVSFIFDNLKTDVREACVPFFSRIYGEIKGEIQGALIAFILRVFWALINKIHSATSSCFSNVYDYLKEAMGSIWQKFSEGSFSTCCLAGAFFSCLFVLLISLIIIAVVFHYLQ